MSISQKAQDVRVLVELGMPTTEISKETGTTISFVMAVEAKVKADKKESKGDRDEDNLIKYGILGVLTLATGLPFLGL